MSLDPHNSALWTIALDSDYDDYTAVSATCTFTASDALWQANKNLFIMAHTGTLAAPANEVLIASISLGDPITLGDTQNFTAQYTARVKETA